MVQNTTDAQLVERARRSGVKGIDEAALSGQAEAHSCCCQFLSLLEQRQTINTRHDSYGYKHMVETPGSFCDTQGNSDSYTTYVYEGTFILAAIACGFRWKQAGSRLHVTFNFSERSLKAGIRQLAARGARNRVQCR